MYIEFLLEEPSAEHALRNLLPEVLGEEVQFRLHPHQGKPDLLSKLPGRLRGYRAWIPEDWYIVVLLDADDEDCTNLKAELERIAYEVGLVTKSAVLPGTRFQVLNRIAVEELEAWFFGDVGALREVYPRISADLARRERYRNPDTIPGGAWEALARLLEYHNYEVPGKISIAEQISRHMKPDLNRSHSFQVFIRGLQEIMHEYA
jgi:hypothetical protein